MLLSVIATAETAMIAFEDLPESPTSRRMLFLLVCLAPGESAWLVPKVQTAENKSGYSRGDTTPRVFLNTLCGWPYTDSATVLESERQKKWVSGRNPETQKERSHGI